MSHSTRHTLCIAAWLLLLLGAGYWAESLLTGADACCYTAAGRLLRYWPAGDYAQLHRPGQPVLREEITLRRPRRQCPTVHYIAWNNAPGDAAAPPTPPKQQELATLLHCLATKLGVQSVAISSPLEWEDEQVEMAGHMLQRALSEYRHACVGIAGRSAATAQHTPELLSSAAIPAAQVQGDTTALPAANTPLPYSLPSPGDAPLLTAPDYLEDEALLSSATRGLSMPLLLRWNGQVLAALPLRLALAELGLSTADVHVKLGKTLRVGDRLLPLDAHGRTPLGAAHAEPLAIEDVLTAYMPLPAAAQRCAVVCRAFTPEPVDSRAACLAATLSQLLSTGSDQLIPTERTAGGHLLEHARIHSSLTGRLITIALFLGLLLLLPRLPRPWQKTALAALAAALLLGAALCAAYGAWLSLCAWWLCWALLSAATYQLSTLRRHHEPSLW